MTVASKAAQNGSKASTSKTTTKPELSKSVVKPVAKQEVTLESRLQSVNELKALIEKRNIFVAKRAEIREFSFGSDEHSCKLEIEHPNGNVFRTSNGFVIKEMSQYLETLIADKIGELDVLIMQFDV